VISLLADHPVQAIGVGFGGPVDTARGRVVTSHQVAGWSGFPLRAWFEKQFGLPVVVENDTNCAALAEARFGAGRGKGVVFYTNNGTGIGGGLVIDGALYNGRLGALEIGHTVFPFVGPLPSAGEGRTPRGVTRPTMNRWATIESLASGLALEQGVTTVPEAARWYGMAIANAITLLNTDIVVVGGGVAMAGKQFWEPLRQTVRQLVFAPFRPNARLVPAGLGETVVVVGAAWLAAANLPDGGRHKPA
jgi:glucokinase